MFNFINSAKQRRAKAVLTKHVNQKCMQDVQGQARTLNRLMDVKAAIVVPGRRNRWDFELATTAINSDVSAGGMCILSREVFTEELLVEIREEPGPQYLGGTVQYCEELGLGYYRIGLEIQEVVQLSRAEASMLAERVAEIETELAV